MVEAAPRFRPLIRRSPLNLSKIDGGLRYRRGADSGAAAEVRDEHPGAGPAGGGGAVHGDPARGREALPPGNGAQDPKGAKAVQRPDDAAVRDGTLLGVPGAGGALVDLYSQGGV